MKLEVGKFIRTKHNAIIEIIEYSEFLDEFRVKCHHREFWFRNLQEQVDIISDNVFDLIKVSDLITCDGELLQVKVIDKEFIRVGYKEFMSYKLKERVTEIWTRSNDYTYHKQWEVS